MNWIHDFKIEIQKNMNKGTVRSAIGEIFVRLMVGATPINLHTIHMHFVLFIYKMVVAYQYFNICWMQLKRKPSIIRANATAWRDRLLFNLFTSEMKILTEFGCHSYMFNAQVSNVHQWKNYSQSRCTLSIMQSLVIKCVASNWLYCCCCHDFKCFIMHLFGK